jgi:lipopolysaccharide export LptBFGC system permease protein LptF
MCAMRGRRAGGQDVAVVLAIAAAATLIVWTMLEWGMPWGNQTFREIIAARLGDGRLVHLEPGLNELGLSRLSQRTDTRAVQHTRLLWALCFATVPLALFSLGLARTVRRPGMAILYSVAAIVTYWAVMANIDAARPAGAFGGIGAWVANILFLVAGLLMLRHGRKIVPAEAAHSS